MKKTLDPNIKYLEGTQRVFDPETTLDLERKGERIKKKKKRVAR